MAVPGRRPGRPGAGDPNQPVTDGALAGTAWVLVGIDDTVDLAGIVPTIAFAADGTVAGLGRLQPVQRPYARRWCGTDVRGAGDHEDGLWRSGRCRRARLPGRAGRGRGLCRSTPTVISCWMAGRQLIFFAVTDWAAAPPHRPILFRVGPVRV